MSNILTAIAIIYLLIGAIKGAVFMYKCVRIGFWKGLLVGLVFPLFWLPMMIHEWLPEKDINKPSEFEWWYAWHPVKTQDAGWVWREHVGRIIHRPYTEFGQAEYVGYIKSRATFAETLTDIRVQEATRAVKDGDREFLGKMGMGDSRINKLLGEEE